MKSKKTDWTYVGYSTNLEKRFVAHQTGSAKSTKAHRPFTLVFYEAYRSPKDAKRREAYFKTTQGKRTMKLMLADSLK